MKHCLNLPPPQTVANIVKINKWKTQTNKQTGICYCQQHHISSIYFSHRILLQRFFRMFFIPALQSIATQDSLCKWLCWVDELFEQTLRNNPRNIFRSPVLYVILHIKWEQLFWKISWTVFPICFWSELLKQKLNLGISLSEFPFEGIQWWSMTPLWSSKQEHYHRCSVISIHTAHKYS